MQNSYKDTIRLRADTARHEKVQKGLQRYAKLQTDARQPQRREKYLQTHNDTKYMQKHDKAVARKNIQTAKRQ